MSETRMTAPLVRMEAGIHPHLPIESYLNDCAPGVSISASGLARILDCPARYWAESYLNPNRVMKTTASLDFGRAAHAWVLGEPAFLEYFIVSPFDDFRTKDARAWRDEQIKTIVKTADLETIKAMAAAIKRTPQTANAWGDGKAEVSIVWQDEFTGIWLKSRPDWLPADPSTHFTQEFKTCASIEPRKISNDVFRYAYDVQAAMMVDGLRTVTGKTPLGIAHVIQEKEPPYLCDLRMFSPEQIAIGRTRYRHALRLFTFGLGAMKGGDPPEIAWPAYTTDPTYFATPKWVTDSLMEINDDEPDSYRTNGFGDILAAG